VYAVSSIESAVYSLQSTVCCESCGFERVERIKKGNRPMVQEIPPFAVGQLIVHDTRCRCWHLRVFFFFFFFFFSFIDFCCNYCYSSLSLSLPLPLPTLSLPVFPSLSIYISHTRTNTFSSSLYILHTRTYCDTFPSSLYITYTDKHFLTLSLHHIHTQTPSHPHDITMDIIQVITKANILLIIKAIMQLSW
jgi:hypothetical protein